MLKAVFSSTQRRILVVDEDLGLTSLIRTTLEHQGHEVTVTDNALSAKELVLSWHPHLVLIDVHAPSLNGMDLLTDLRDSESLCSIIIISDKNSPDEIAAGLDSGADDYISKPFDKNELVARVRAQLRLRDMNEQLLSNNARLQELVDIDDLTGLLNMRSTFERLEHELMRGKRHERTVCVIMMDMDHFKGVNDGHDHLFGSFVLSEVGKIIRSSIRNIDIAARYGGDEFLMVLSEVDKEAAFSFCERLRQSVEAYTFKSGSDTMKLTASIGFSLTDPKRPDVDPKQLVRVADWALYEAKRSGRNRVCFFDLAEHPEFSQQTYKKAQ
ncbi:MAG: hypothetical protein RJB66_1117 [Pseudomonadota bacterium]|jgi:diguanylate cyclase (GGDEF)-like protein